MNTSGRIKTRIQFLAPTRDHQGQFTHHAGEVITGELVAQKQDFLLVQTDKGYMYVDSSRCDLYCVEMQTAF